MPAKLDLLPRKEFLITLETGEEIHGKYGIWAITRFTEKKKTTLSGLQAILTDPQLMDVLEFILCAVEQKTLESKQPMKYSVVDVGMWLDEMGGMSSPDFIALFNHSGSDDEKKSDPAAEPQLSGQTSSALQPAQG